MNRPFSIHAAGLLLLVVGLGASLPATAQDLVVSPAGPITRISDAIAQAEAGARIVIQPGHYREGMIRVDKPVSLIGEGFPIVDGEGKEQVILVTADSVTIRGLDVRNAGVSFVRDHAGIKLENARYGTIEHNRLQDNFFGIYLAGSRDTRVAHNQIQASGTRETTSGNGIHLWHARNVVIEDNYIAGHRDGIYLEFVEDGMISGNVSEGNLRYGLHFMFSDRCVYANNTFRQNGAGVAVMYTKRVQMLDNRFEHNWGPASYGLLLKDISDSEIRGNVFVRNTIAIHAEGSNRIQVERNRFARNGWAVRIMSNSTDNYFSANNFLDNAFDVTTNSRRNPNTFRGNYWNRYDGYDLSGDGIGDVPHRPVRLFALIVERHPAAMILLRSLFVDLLDLAEKVIPVLTPETLVDEQPMMREIL